MPESKVSSISDLEECWLRGDTDEAFRTCSGVVKQLADNTLVGEDALRARVVCARLHLVAMDKSAAELVLADYVSRPSPEQRLVVNDAALEALTPSGLYRSQLYSQVANLLFECFDYPNGVRVAGLARKECEKPGAGGGASSLAALLTRAEAVTWWSRLAWRVGEHDQARSDLTALKDQLAEARDREEIVGGIDLALSIVAILLAAYEQRLGRLDEARVRIHQAMYLLSSNSKGCHDRIRFGYATYELAITEAIVGELSHFRWPIRLFEDVELHLERKHPIRWRARNRLAQCYIRIDQSALANEILDRLSEEIEESTDIPRAPDDERHYIEAEIALTRIWIAERRARDPSFRVSWDDCLEQSKKQIDSAALVFLPLRIQTEVAQHYGLALCHTNDVPGARRQLARARDLAEENRRSRVQVATLFASAECEIEGNDQKKAIEFFEKGKELLGLERSIFLEEWRDRLSAEVRRGIHLTIADDTTYEAADRAFREAYKRYHLNREDGDLERVLKRTKIPRSTWFRWLKKEKEKTRDPT